MRNNSIIIAGTHSGAGKTTVSLGLMRLFSQKGLKVQPFKVGPDFIDPSLHSLLCGRASRNLDSFLLPQETLRYLYQRAARKADISIIEGVGGLFDGYSGTNPKGSTAEIASILDCPVLLVCDAYSSSRSIAAVVKGFSEFNPKVRIAGVVLNRLANPKHREWCETAIRQTCKVPVLGALYASKELEMKERHMGLIPAAEKKLGAKWLKELSQQMDKNFDWKRILKISRSDGSTDVPNPSKAQASGRRVKIGIAKDSAFSFYYQDNLDLLADWGADLVPFSPLNDRGLPKGLDGCYLGGGFPEMHGRELEENASFKRGFSIAVENGMPVYAECGGLMYLGKNLKDIRNKNYEMTDVLPFSTEMTSKIFMGYVKAETRRDHLLAHKGEKFPGQIFHFSRLKPEKNLQFAYGLSNGYQTFPDGVSNRNVLASYMHLHFWSKPSLAGNFVNRCAEWGALRS